MCLMGVAFSDKSYLTRLTGHYESELCYPRADVSWTQRLIQRVC